MARHFLVLSLEKLSFLGGVYTQMRCLPQLTAGDTVKIVCVDFFPYAQVRSHIGVVLASDTFLAPCKAHGGSLDKLLPGEYGRGQVCRRTLGQGAACQHDPHQSVAGGDLQAPGKTRIKAEGKGLQ